MYTIEDLENAREELRIISESINNDSSNNPDKYQSEYKTSALQVKDIELSLKESGIIPWTEQELLDLELDKMYPNAKSKSIHKKDGKKYQIIYSPQEMSRSRKTVMKWIHTWVLVAGL